MSRYQSVLLLCAVVFIGGCASGLSSIEKRQYMAYEREGVLIKEKNPTTGAVLGLLPGIGSFYAREPALGVVNLLFWPISILWDPISGYQGSKSINYSATVYQRKQQKDKALDELADNLAVGHINSKQYIAKKRDIERKYDVN